MLATERANESKKEEGKRNSLLFLLEYTMTIFLMHTVFDEANRKIAHFTRAVQSARCERSWREERDVSTKN